MTCATCQYEAEYEKTGTYPSPAARVFAQTHGCLCKPDEED